MLSSHSPGKAASVIVLQVVLRQHESARTRPDGPAREPSKAAQQKLNRDPKNTILRSLVVIMVVPCRPWHHEPVFITAIYTICNSSCIFVLLSRSYLPLVHSGTYGFTQWIFCGNCSVHCEARCPRIIRNITRPCLHGLWEAGQVRTMY